MSWDAKRGGRRYYYRSRKVAGRCVKSYLGRGPVAELAARLDGQERDARDARRLALARERARLAEADLPLRRARDLIGLLVAAALLLSGWHEHRGEWRRRSGQTTQGDRKRGSTARGAERG
jgi:hypothetical protein